MSFDVTTYILLKQEFEKAMEGVPHLNDSGQIPSEVLPSYVDDIRNGYLHNGNFYYDAQFTELMDTEDGIIYVDLTTNSTYRWSGEAYVRVNEVNLDNYYTKNEVNQKLTGKQDTTVTIEGEEYSINELLQGFYDTIVELQEGFNKAFNEVDLPAQQTTGTITQAQYDSLGDRTLVKLKTEGSTDNVTYIYAAQALGAKIFMSFASNDGYSLIGFQPNLTWTKVDFNAEDKTHKVTSWSSTPNDIHYPSEKLVKDSLDSETTRATAQENKSLYHLGAFDSSDGKTRQTYYTTLTKADNWVLNGNGTIYYNTKSAGFIVAPSGDNVKGQAYCDKLELVKYDDLYSQSKTSGIAISSSGSIAISVSDYANLTSIVVQCKLSQPYTDTPIEGESILPLDTTMAQMIRQDVVDSLNLWNGKSLTKSSAGTGYYGTLANFFNGFELNKTYTIGFRNSGSNAFSIELKNGNTLISYIVVNPNEYKGITFNAVDLSYILNIYFSGASTCDYTIFEGSVLYPPSDYHARKHITDEEADLLKDEYKKSSNLWKHASSITKTGGGYVFDNYINPLKKGTYTFSFVFSGTTSQTQFIVKDVNDNILVNPIYDLVNGLNSITFTINSDSYYISFYGNSAGTYSNVMLNEGSEAQPYSENYGDLVHKKDLQEAIASAITTTLNTPV